MKKYIVRILALLLVAAMLILPLSSCSSGKKLLTLKVDGKTYSISVNLYELMLSITKGSLDAYGYTLQGKRPTDSAFWDMMDTFDGLTYQTAEAYYRQKVLEDCKTYLVALYLFDQYDLKLSESVLQEIEDTMEEFVLTDGEGSKTKLNSVLAEYGVNYKMLKEYYIMRAKFQAVQEHIYSSTGPNVKNQYVSDHYVHFYQIFLANYTYVYETDKNGDTVYYNPSTNQVLYKVTEYTQTTSSGDIQKDSKGQVIYYTDVTRTHISYDTEKGQPSYKIDKDGESYVTKPMTADELLQLEERATKLLEGMTGDNKITKDAFIAKVNAESDDKQAAIYTDGTYLQKDVDYAASNQDYMYLNEFVKELSNPDLKNGDVIMLSSPSGYHILMKCAPTDKAYELEENEVWFTSFASSIVSELFTNFSSPYIKDIQINERVYATVPSMKEVGANYFYY